MNKLTLDIGLEKDSEKSTLLLFIDGEEFRTIIGDAGNAAFFPELSDSLKGSGEYLIFTCLCGVADCGGWNKVQVAHLDTAITWKFDFNELKFVFTFDLQNYKNEIFKLQKRLDLEDVILEPTFVFDPE